MLPGVPKRGNEASDMGCWPWARAQEKSPALVYNRRLAGLDASTKPSSGTSEMCGIAGLLLLRDQEGRETLAHLAGAMAETLRHRGPDDAGVWADPAAGIGLGHRRLSVIDLSAEGRQPMVSASGRYVIAYNGEVYNFPALRKELEPPERRFRGHSDTEVILAAIEAWGLEGAAKRFIGMFAFALWDREARELSLVRDRIGIKPLYYGWMGDTFLFGSELKALQAHPTWQGEIDREALCLFMRFGYIPTPYSIYRGIHKLVPGTILSLRQDGSTRQPYHYWCAKLVVEDGDRNRFTGGEGEALDQLESLLSEAVRCRMVSDVPLGALLSGGIDSSTVVALMQKASSQPVKTFTIGFHEEEYDEAPHAKAVAERLGTEHTELYVSTDEAKEVIPALPTLYDEPFADSSQIPTCLVSQMARRHVTVCLSGDGGDELFAGYLRYRKANQFWNLVRWAPGPARRAVAGLLARVGASRFRWPKRALELFIPDPRGDRRPGDGLARIREAAGAESSGALYRDLMSHFKAPSSLVLGGTESGLLSLEGEQAPELGSFIRRMMYADLVQYHRDDILTKLDRASMGVSLEARVPLIDHRVVEFAARLPTRMLLRGGDSKWLLRQILYRHVPKALIDRPKRGFGVPLARWLRTDLREWTEDLLDESRLRRQGFLDPDLVRTVLHEHLSGDRNREHQLWNLLMFEAWLETQAARAEAKPR